MRRTTLLHVVLTLAAVGAMLRLSAWQWERATTRGSLLNYTYAVEWLLLAILLVVALLMRRRRSGSLSDDSGSRDVHGRLIGPPLREHEDPGDPTGVRVTRRLRGRPRS